MRVEAPRGASSAYRITRPDRSHVALVLDDVEVGRSAEEQAIANLLLWSVNQEVSARTQARVLVHGGAVTTDDEAIVLIGASGAGKSTLTAALVAAGFGYLTDEAVGFALDDGIIQAYHRPISLKPGSWRLFRHAKPDAPPADPPFTAEVWHVGPGRLHPDPFVATGVPARLVFLTRDEGVTAELCRMRPAEAAAGLADHALNLSRLGQPGLDCLAAVAERTPAYHLGHGDLTAAVEAVAVLATG